MENNQMTIHDILSFPRRIFEVLDDLHAAAKFVEGASLNYSVVGDAVASRAVADSALYRAKKEIDALRARIAELESQLLTTHDSLDCANSKITETESEVVAWTTRCAKDEERLAESNRKVAVLESQLKAHGIECEIRRAKR
jgi:chromosome segregation ATPase